MRLTLSVWFTLALGLGLAGLLVGGVGGLAGSLLQDTPESIAGIAGLSYWLLVPALPLALWGLTDISLDAEENNALYASPNRTFGVLIAAGLAGALAASAVFYIPATNLPNFIDSTDAVAMRLALYDRVGWTQIIVVAIVTVAAAAAIASWAMHRAKSDAAEAAPARKVKR